MWYQFIPWLIFILLQEHIFDVPSDPSGLLDPCLRVSRVSVTILRSRCAIRCVSIIRLLFLGTSSSWRERGQQQTTAILCQGISFQDTTIPSRFLMSSVYCLFLGRSHGLFPNTLDTTCHNCLHEGSLLDSTMNHARNKHRNAGVQFRHSGHWNQCFIIYIVLLLQVF